MRSVNLLGLGEDFTAFLSTHPKLPVLGGQSGSSDVLGALLFIQINCGKLFVYKELGSGRENGTAKRSWELAIL